MPSEIDGMTLPEVEMLSGYWERCPPVHLLVRSAVGFQPTKSGTAREEAAGDFKPSSIEDVMGFFSEFETKTGTSMKGGG